MTDIEDRWDARPTFSVPSQHHQTLLSKAIFEHCLSYCAVATIAMASKSIQNSSLAANLLFDMKLTPRSVELFSQVFHPSSALTIQFSPGFTVDTFAFQTPMDLPKKLSAFIRSLISATKYFHKSLRSLTCGSAIWDFLCYNKGMYFEKKLGPNLTSLSVDCSMSFNDDMLKTIVVGSKMPNLRHLDISRCPLLTNKGIRHLMEESSSSSSSSPLQLLSLDLSSRFSPATKINNETLKLVAQIPTLRTLILEACTEITDPGLAHLAKANQQGKQSLQSLNLHHVNEITDGGIVEHVCTIHTLTSLNLFNCNLITDASVKEISANLVNLKFLNLNSCTKMRDPGAVSLANLKNLVELHLCACCNITDSGLSFLKELKELEDLDLSYNYGISNEGLIRNLEANRKLKVIKIQNNEQISEETVKTLQSMLPNLMCVEV